MSSTDVQFVIALAGALGAGGWLGAVFQGYADRRHQTELSRRKLLNAQMRLAYGSYLEQVYVVQAVALRIEPRSYYPDLGLHPHLLDYAGDERVVQTFTRAAAVASVMASERVAESMGLVMEAWRGIVEELKTQERTPDSQRPASGLEPARSKLDDAIAELERRMRTDVRA